MRSRQLIAEQLETRKLFAADVFSTSDSPFTPDVANQGWWTNTQIGRDTNDNYFVGTNDQNLEFRNFFSFDVSRLDLDANYITGARLTLERYTQGSRNLDETYALFDVSTDAAVLNYNNALFDGARPDIFEDLGTGDSYGQYVVRHNDANQATITLELNEAALHDIAAAVEAGGFFSLGGKLLTADGPNQFLFGFSSDQGTQLLTVDFEPKIGVQINAKDTFNLNSNAPFPIAILSNSIVDTTTVDLSTIEINGVSPQIFKTKIEDVNGDGRNDLVVYYRVSELVSSGALNAQSVDIVLEAGLTDSLAIIHGTDTVKRKGKA